MDWRATSAGLAVIVGHRLLPAALLPFAAAVGDSRRHIRGAGDGHGTAPGARVNSSLPTCSVRCSIAARSSH